MSEPWDKAKNLLRTALNEVEKLSEDSFRPGPAVPAVMSTPVQPRSSGSDYPGTSGTGTQLLYCGYYCIAGNFRVVKVSFQGLISDFR